MFPKHFRAPRKYYAIFCAPRGFSAAFANPVLRNAADKSVSDNTDDKIVSDNTGGKSVIWKRG